MAKTLYLNGHIYPDGVKDIENGAILVEDGRIKDVFYQTPKTIDDDVELVDLEGLSVLPGLFSYVEIDDIDLDSADELAASLASQGILAFVASLRLDSLKAIEQLINFDADRFKQSKCFGLHLIIERNDIPDAVIEWLCAFKGLESLSFSANINQATVDTFKATGHKVFVKNSDEEYLSLNIDGYWDIFDRSYRFDPFVPNVISSAFLYVDKYISFSDNVYPDTLKLLFKFHDHRRLLARGSIANLLNQELDLIDISNILAINYYRLYHFDKAYGGLIKGKFANFVIVDEKAEIVAVFNQGVIVK